MEILARENFCSRYIAINFRFARLRLGLPLKQSSSLRRNVKIDSHEFKNRGLLALRGFLPLKSVALARESLLAELTRMKIKVDGKIASSKFQKMPIFQQTSRLGQMMKVGDPISRLFSEDLLRAIGSLGGSPLRSTTSGPQVLLSLPHKKNWSLTDLNWHLDVRAPKTDQAPGIQAFILIDDVQPRGGGTLALAGSHKLHYVNRQLSALGVLKEKSRFFSEPEKFLQPQDVCGIPVQIVEMSGRAGDLFLMDLRILHSPSVNSRPDIRMMATTRFINPR